MRAFCAIGGCVFVLAGGIASAQDQVLIVDRPLAACTVPADSAVTSATLTEAQAKDMVAYLMDAK